MTYYVNQNLEGNQRKHHILKRQQVRRADEVWFEPYCGQDRRQHEPDEVIEMSESDLLYYLNEKDRICLKCAEMVGLRDSD